MFLQCIALRDCKIWYENGYTVNGNYTIYPNGETPVEVSIYKSLLVSVIHCYIYIQVYCDMEGINCDGEGGWTRVTYLNMTEPNATCPAGLILQEYDNIDHPLCGRDDKVGCNSASFSSTGLMYSKVCGQVRGYHYNNPDAFTSIGVGIDSYYVDGVSITYGTNPRKHIWTYAVGISEQRNDSSACPCNSDYNGSRVPASTFIGSHYYCESGKTKSDKPHILYADDPLWDGQQCNGREGPCCPANSTMPWFYQSLDTHTNDDIELRVCASALLDNEEIPLDIIELYIK